MRVFSVCIIFHRRDSSEAQAHAQGRAISLCAAATADDDDDDGLRAEICQHFS